MTDRFFLSKQFCFQTKKILFDFIFIVVVVVVCCMLIPLSEIIFVLLWLSQLLKSSFVYHRGSPYCDRFSIRCVFYSIFRKFFATTILLQHWCFFYFIQVMRFFLVPCSACLKKNIVVCLRIAYIVFSFCFSGFMVVVFL